MRSFSKPVKCTLYKMNIYKDLRYAVCIFSIAPSGKNNFTKCSSPEKKYTNIILIKA